MTNIEQAALGRMGYSLRALVMGWRVSGERIPLIVRVLLNEAINLCLQTVASRLEPGRQLFEDHADGAWNAVLDSNPHLRDQHGGN